MPDTAMRPADIVVQRQYRQAAGGKTRLLQCSLRFPRRVFLRGVAEVTGLRRCHRRRWRARRSSWHRRAASHHVFSASCFFMPSCFMPEALFSSSCRRSSSHRASRRSRPHSVLSGRDGRTNQPGCKPRRNDSLHGAPSEDRPCGACHRPFVVWREAGYFNAGCSRRPPIRALTSTTIPTAIAWVMRSVTATAKP